MNRIKNKQGYYRQILTVNNRIGDRRKREIKIPVELCFYILKEKLLPTFKVYIVLKMTCSGKCKLSKWDKEEFADFCGYGTEKSLNNQLKRLIELNWIGYNKESMVYHIRGFETIQKQHQLFTRTGFWFAIQDMQCFDAVIYGAVIGYLSKSQGKKRRTDPESGRSSQVLCKSPGFYPISNWSLAKILNISISTASLMKRRAEEEHCIFVKRKRIAEPATPDVYKRLKDGYPEYFKSRIFWKHCIYLRFPDLVKANLKYGTRKKIDI